MAAGREQDVQEQAVHGREVQEQDVQEQDVHEREVQEEDMRGTGPGRGSPAIDECVRVPTAAQMRDLGTRLAGLLRAGDLVVLSGGLGAGKTTLTQGIGAGLGVRGPVTSPTFVIARVHPSLRGGPDLVHADAYRLGSRAEIDDLDLDTDVDSSVTVVEWGEGLAEGLAPSFLEIAIAPAPDPPKHADDVNADDVNADDIDEARTVRVVGWGERWRNAAQAARQVLSGAAAVRSSGVP
jgi:tRNA threonylcarbamoyladenosine biosynthesis protein TsaE